MDANGRVVLFARATDGRFAWPAPNGGVYALAVGEGGVIRTVRVVVPKFCFEGGGGEATGA